MLEECKELIDKKGGFIDLEVNLLDEIKFREWVIEKYK